MGSRDLILPDCLRYGQMPLTIVQQDRTGAFIHWFPWHTDQGSSRSKGVLTGQKAKQGHGCSPGRAWVSQQWPTEDGAPIRGEVWELGQKTLTQ